VAQEKFAYRRSEIDRLPGSEHYAIQIDVRGDDRVQAATRWMSITPAELAAIREILREDKPPAPAPKVDEYVNVGAHDGLARPATEQELRRALADNPGAVVFDATAAFGSRYGSVFAADDLPPGVSLSVCGPDPYASREWWVQVVRGADGNPVVVDTPSDDPHGYLD
jgi:hypothetical protein